MSIDTYMSKHHAEYIRSYTLALTNINIYDESNEYYGIRVGMTDIFG